jgi:hypothetical protein
MGRRPTVLITSAAACCTLAIGTGMATASGATAAPAGHWGNARNVSGLGKLNAGGDTGVAMVSCTTPGNCTAAGGYSDSAKQDHPFAADEKGGTWGKAVTIPAPTPSATSSFANSLSCGAPGNCVAGGSFSVTGSPDKGFVASEENGTWDSASAVSGGATFSDTITVACASAGNCAAGGFIADHSGAAVQPFVMDEKNGAWGLAQLVPGLAGLKASGGTTQAISCASPGNCGAVGTYTDASANSQVFVVDERNGTWRTALPVPEMSMLKATSSFAHSVSCASPGNCTVGGTYTDEQKKEQVFIEDEVNGTWGTPQQVPGTGALNVLGIARVNQVSCATAGNCAAVGFYTDRNGLRHAFAADEKAGTWQAVRTLAGAGTLSKGGASAAEDVSCASPGNCAASGWWDANSDGGQQAFTASEVNGAWGKARVVPGSAALNKDKTADALSVSCSSPGNCAAGGYYFDSRDNQNAFLVDESTATGTSLSLSAARIRFGHEQGEKISVKVTSRTGGTPGGKVTVRAQSATVCVITLSGGKGSCVLAAKKLNPGTYQLTAGYGGSQAYDASASAAKTLTVTR